MSTEPLKNQIPKYRDIWVILPAYNEENIIGEVLQELFTRKLKLVIIDDGSTDGTYQIARDIVMDNPGKGFLYHHPVNRGLGPPSKQV